MLLDGTTLRQVFAWQNPFRPASKEEPDALVPGASVSGAGNVAEIRRTILAVNVNFPAEIEAKAFCRAAADWPGSPLIIQYSHGALKILGGQDPMAASSGARLGRLIVEHYAREAGVRHVALALDHFRVPPYPGDGGEGNSRTVRVARATIDDALEASRALTGAVPDSDLETYVTYLSSPAYVNFKREFAAVLTALEPAWAMIDTERLPPVLDYALTRDVADFIRRGLGLADTMLEVEYGATGKVGEMRAYEVRRGEDLARFAEEVASFVAYTGADGIAYPIGMEHGAPTAERHEPDEARLAAVQQRILQITGRYVPFAQHGGTGAARLVVGLVGKNNVNTHFLAVAANRLADITAADGDRIRAGVKDACGPSLYEGAVEAIRAATVDKLKEAGTHGASPAIDSFLAS